LEPIVISVNSLSLIIIASGLTYAVFRAVKTHNIAELAFLPFWIYLGWHLLGSHSLPIAIAPVLLAIAFFARKAGMQRVSQNRSHEQESDPADAIITDRDPMPTDEAEEEAGLGLLKRLFPEKSPAELDSMSRQIADSQETEEMLQTPPNELPYEPLLEISREEWGELCHAARNPPLRSEEANIFMWSRLYRLHHWIYINTGGELCLKPFAGIVNEKPSLMLFTSEAAAADFIATNRLADREEDVSLGAFILPGTLAHIQGFESTGIAWVCFNMGPEGSFGGPINQLCAGYAWHRKNDPLFALSV
jgi:hypothetical protein